MDTGNEGNCCHSKKSQEVIATKDITKISLSVERDKFEEILTQNDMTIDDMTKMSGKKSLKKMSKQQQLDEEICYNDSVERINCRLDSSILKRRRQSIDGPSLTNVEYEQLRLECARLQDIQKSLQDDNESLRMVNKILRSNYDMLKERLELVQSEHQLRLTHLDQATQILKSASTNKRVRSNQYDDSLESSASNNKRRRFEGNGRDNDLQIVVRTSSASREVEFSSDISNASANDRCTSETEDLEHSDAMDSDVNGTEDFDHFNSNDKDISGTDSEDDDIEFIPTNSEPISIDSSDITDGNDDSAADKENEDGRSENLDNDSFGDESLSDNDYSFLKPLSEYSIVRNQLNATQNQTAKSDRTTEGTILELRARLAEAKTRGDNFCLINRELKQDLTERANYIKSLESNEERMEKQLELADEKYRVLWTELTEAKLTLREKEQQVDHLNSEIRSLTTNLTLLKDSKEEQDVNVSMLKTALDQCKMKMGEKESTISTLNLKNQILKNQLKAKTQRFRETLENENRIEELKEILNSYLLQKNRFLQNLWYCEDCYSTQRKLKELERILRDYNHMKEVNRELNERLELYAEENKHLNYKIMRGEADYAKKIDAFQNEVQIELRKKTLNTLCHQELTNSNPVSQKRPREFTERSSDSNIPVQDLGNDPPSQTGDNSCHRCRHDTNSCRCRHETTPEIPETTSQSGSPVFRTVTLVAEIHPEPGPSDNSHSKKPRLAPHQKENVTKKSAEGVASPFRTPNRLTKLRKLRPDQASTPSVSLNRVTTRSGVTTRSAVRNDVNAADRINIIDEENKENDEKDTPTGHRNRTHDMSYDDSVVIPNSKGEKTIIGERLVVLEQIERSSEANTDKTDSEPILIVDDSVADKKNEDDTSENSDNESPSDADNSFLKPLGQYGSQNQTSKPK